MIKIINKNKMVLFFIVFTVMNLKLNFIYFPTSEDMIDYQFNFFTSTTVVAGFSFTALSTLLSLTSERIMDDLKGTTVLQKLCMDIVSSIKYLLFSSAVSLILILKLEFCIKHIGWKIVEDNFMIFQKGIFTVGVGCTFLGIVYFVKAIFVIAQLINKIFGLNKERLDKQIEEYAQSIEKVKSTRKALLDEESSDEW